MTCRCHRSSRHHKKTPPIKRGKVGRNTGLCTTACLNEVLTLAAHRCLHHPLQRLGADSAPMMVRQPERRHDQNEGTPMHTFAFFLVALSGVACFSLIMAAVLSSYEQG